MQYDWTTVMDRRGMDALAIDGLGAGGAAPAAPREGFDAIPMWVADMNFPAPPSVTAAIIRRAQHPAFGYFSPRDAYFDEIIRWQRDRNGVQGLTRDAIGYENGVLGGLVSTLECFTRPGDAVLVHSPTYIGFTKSIENIGRRIVLSPLRIDETGTWRMDFDDMERKLGENHIHAVVFCSPHNPCGRVWERPELERAMELFRAHDCVVVSDEIWSDIVLPGHAHMPTQSVSEDARRRTVALYAPSKTFNLAGLVGSYHVIYDECLRDRVRSASSKSHYNSMNVLSMHALIGAYGGDGRAWVDELRRVIDGNVSYACDYIRDRFEGVSVQRPEGTYMLFVDCAGWLAAHGRTLDELERACWDVGVAVQDGRMFHGPTHLRMNLALPLSRVEEAFARLDRHVFNA